MSVPCSVVDPPDGLPFARDDCPPDLDLDPEPPPDLRLDNRDDMEDRLKDILARSGFNTGALAQICISLESWVGVSCVSVQNGTYNAEINLYGCSNPKGIRVPSLIIFDDQAFVDVPRPYDTCNCDDET